MHGPPLTYVYSPTPPDANNETMLLDSTRQGASTDATNSNGRIAPGLYRARWAGKRVRATVKNGDQGITINLLLATAPALTTNGIWEVDATAESNGEIAIAASTTKVIDWHPRSPDFAVELECGATATSAITVTFTLVDNPSPSV